MRKEMKEYFMLWSETEEFMKKVKMATKTISELEGRLMVMFSGGKDSTVILHLTSSLNKDFIIYHFDYGPALIPKDIENTILRNMRVIAPRAEVEIIRANIGRSEAENAKFYRLWWGSIERTIEKHRVNYVVSALRAEESIKRKLLTSESRELGQALNIFPIRHWSWRDVWAYIISNNLPYPQVYDKYGELLGYDKARFVTFFDEELETYGTPNIDKYVYWKYYNEK